MEKSGFKDLKPTLPELISFPLSSGKELNLIGKISSDYQKFGILLLNDDDGTKVKTIEMQSKSNVEAIIIEIFREWFKGRGKEPVAWHTLVNVLKRSKLQSLAKDIEGLKHDDM